MSDSEDENVLYAPTGKDLHHQGKSLLKSGGVKNVDDVLNGPSDKRRLKKTIALCGAFIGLGLAVAVLGPTLGELEKHLQVDLPHVSFIFTGRSIGYVVGSIIGGITFERIHPLLLIAITLGMSGLGLLATPYCQQLMTSVISISFAGVAMGALDTGANVVCVRMWGKKSAPFMQALHFSFALGAFIAPLLAGPFIGLPSQPSNSTVLQGQLSNSTNFTTTPNLTVGNTSVPSNKEESAHKRWVLPEFTNDLLNQDLGDQITHSKIHSDEAVQRIDKRKASRRSRQLIHRLARGANDNKKPPENTEDKNKKSTTPPGETTATPENTGGENKINATATPENTTNNSTTTTGNKNDNTTSGNETNNIIPGNALLSAQRFQGVYIIIAVFLMLMAIVFTYFFCTSPLQLPHASESSKTLNMPNMKPSDKHFTNYILGLLFLFYFLYVGAEVGYGGFIFTFARNKTDPFSPKEATHLNSLFWGTFAIGRGLSICIASIVSPLTMIVIDILGCIVSSLALAYEADTNPLALWVGTAVLGASMASLYPAGISWLESHAPVTGNMASLLIVGAALGEMVIPLLLGNLFNSHIGPMSLMYVMFVTSVLTVIIFAIAVYLAASEGKDFEGPEPLEEMPAVQILQGVQESIEMPDITVMNRGPGQTTKPVLPMSKSHKE